MRKKIFTKVICFIMGVIVFSTCTISSKAQENDTVYQYTDREGQIYNYYLDENKNPYIISDGEIIYVALPLDFLEVTDEETLQELQSSIKTNSNERSAPTNYVDISTGGNPSGLASPEYTMNVTFNSQVTNKKTDVLKVNTSHNRVFARVSNVSKPIWVLDSDVTVVLYFYDEIEDKWFSNHYIGQNLTVNPLNIQFLSGINEFIQFDVRQSSPVSSFTFTTWTAAII